MAYTDCPDCEGNGEVYTGKDIPADIFGPREPIFDTCDTCRGAGQLDEEDVAFWLDGVLDD